MTRSAPTASLALVLLAGACRSSAAPDPTPPPVLAPGRPNLIVVMTDDQGFGDFGALDHPVLRTPRLDAFRAECPPVERFYVSPVCSPTRASLMTGRYHMRTGVVDTWRGRSMMDPSEVTFAEVLRDAGYDTGLFGKWHLGDCYPMRAQDQGFAETLVHRGGGIGQPSDPVGAERKYTDAALFRNGERVETKGYCTDVYFDAALDFIDASTRAGSPFLAVITPNAPHGPFGDVPPAEYAGYRDRDYSAVVRGDGVDTDRIARIFAMIENIDSNFGRLLDRLDELGIADDTMVMFLCDNGPVAGRTVAGLRAFKSSVYEGGVRSPLLVRWPGRVDPRATVLSVSAHIDVFPTLLDAAGVAVPSGVALDGRSLLARLCGRGEPWPNRQLFLQAHRGNEPSFEHHFAVIEAQWKLVRASGFGRVEAPEGHPFELFDLKVDPGEERDVAAENPSVVARLRAGYGDWFRDVTSREGGFVPPRIVVGSDEEPVTVLTRQDWRSEVAGGWGAGGRWGLVSEEERMIRIVALPLAGWVGEASPEVVRVKVGAVTFTRDVGAGVWGREGIDLGVVQVPGGEFELGVEFVVGEGVIDAYQLEVSRG